MRLEDRILVILNEIKLSEASWEDGERILTFNGKPVGSTFARAEVERWWGQELKRLIADYVAKRLKEDLIGMIPA